MKKNSLLGLLLITFLAGVSQPVVNSIRINQLGYYRYAPKIAIWSGAGEAAWFYLLQGPDTVFKGRPGNLVQSTNSSLQTRALDFTAFHGTGQFVIAVPGQPLSYKFVIGDKVNYAAATASLKGFYYQRVSMPLEAAYAGQWARAAGHPDNIVFIHPSAASSKLAAGTVIRSPGGWYDAGDYNKYIVNSGITMGTLLSAYEDFPAYFDSLNTHIPESTDALPDIINEILYNLRWMLTMQDAADGGVYHKCTNASFDGMVMPGVSRLPRYVVQKSTAATLDFAAVMAQAARVMQQMDTGLPGLRDSCLRAAKKAWQWAVKNPALSYDQNTMNQEYEPKITTGAYGDKRFDDEWFWAAAELATVAKDKEYSNILAGKINDTMVLPSWSNVRMLGFYTLLRNEASLPLHTAALVAPLKKRLLELADSYLLPVKTNAFQTVMGRSVKDFNWGSNSNAANQGILMIYAYKISGDSKYIDAALTNLDYIMGRNATGYCFVTGIGSFSTMHPHHRPSIADGIAAPVPGLLAGGPNPGKQDKCVYAFSEPETAYSDTDCSYASNEIAINWNAPLVYLANAIEALQWNSNYSRPHIEK
jgi:endoglucanase